jgi:hypothetical protein
MTLCIFRGISGVMNCALSVSLHLEEFFIIASFQSEVLNYQFVQFFCENHASSLKRLTVHGNWQGLASGPSPLLYASFSSLEELR